MGDLGRAEVGARRKWVGREMGYRVADVTLAARGRAAPPRPAASEVDQTYEINATGCTSSHFIQQSTYCTGLKVILDTLI